MSLTLHHKDNPNAIWDILAFDPANHNMMLRGKHSLQQLIMPLPDLKTAGFVVTEIEGTRELWYHPESDSYVENFDPDPNREHDPLQEDVSGIFDHEVRYFLRTTVEDKVLAELNPPPIGAPLVDAPADGTGLAALAEQVDD